MQAGDGFTFHGSSDRNATRIYGRVVANQGDAVEVEISRNYPKRCVRWERTVWSAMTQVEPVGGGPGGRETYREGQHRPTPRKPGPTGCS